MKALVEGARNIHDFFRKFYGKNTRVNLLSDNYNVKLNMSIIIAGGLKPQYKCCLDIFESSEVGVVTVKLNTILSNEVKISFNKEKLISERFLEINIFYRDKEDLNNLYVELKKLTSPYKDHTPKKPVELEMLVPPDDKTDPNYKKYMKQYWKNMNELYAEK